MRSVTVLLPTYNAMPFLPTAVESIFAQRGIDDLRLFVVDDGSNDGSLEYLHSLSDSRLTVLEKEHSGLNKTLNFGLDRVETEFVSRMDGDDWSEPHRIETQLDYLQAHPDVALVGSQIHYFCEDATVFGFRSSLPTSHEDIDRLLLEGRHALVHPSVTFRTEAIRSIGGYKPNEMAEEVDLFLRVAEKFKVANQDEVLLRYRVHGGNLSSQRAREFREQCSVAAKRSLARRGGQEPPDVEALLSSYRASPVAGVLDSLDVISLRYYRIGICHRLKQRRLRAFLSFALAGLASPQRVFGVIEKRLRFRG